VSVLLELCNISHSFGEKLFQDISLSINENQKIAIIGESGCGKSTLLHIMATFLRPDSGNVKLFNQDIYSLSKNEIIQHRRHNISIIFQQHYLFKGFSLYENLQVASLVCGQNIDKDLMDRFGLSDKQNFHAGALSGGEQQRASIARALVKQPKIIFADELTGNLDYKNSKKVIDILFDYVEESKSSIVIVTHDRSVADKCDKIFEISKQRLNIVS